MLSVSIVLPLPPLGPKNKVYSLGLTFLSREITLVVSFHSCHCFYGNSHLFHLDFSNLPFHPGQLLVFLDKYPLFSFKTTFTSIMDIINCINFYNYIYFKCSSQFSLLHFSFKYSINFSIYN